MKINDLLSQVPSPLPIQIDPFSELMLNHLMNMAQTSLDALPDDGDMLQVTALYTSRDNFYTGITYGPQAGEQLLCQLQEQDDTQVTHLVSLWKQGGLDVSSYDFRNALLKMNDKNGYAVFPIQGHERLVSRTIGASMPPKGTAK